MGGGGVLHSRFLSIFGHVRFCAQPLSSMNGGSVDMINVDLCLVFLHAWHNKEASPACN